MGLFGPPASIALLLAVAIVAAAGGFAASAVMRRNKRRTRMVFLLGALFGFVAGLRGRKRLKAALPLPLRGLTGQLVAAGPSRLIRR
ncbi:hypothetical protein [Mycobacterium sp. E740]|uniref:hypothetical protein n=1 Tax=Mycobacterium sp. E740 TaxID=1834149 RepID=UPI0007FC2373|nr:hypothetical protein [Mycobacterium sp. E740]OBI75656.1 hypothetical protein A5663_00310 [Mycobacterium sp. E740]